MQGSVRQKAPNRWQVRVSLGRDAITGRYRYVHRDVVGTKREAQRAAAQLVAEVDRGLHQQVRRITVAELMDRWMEHTETQGRAPSTQSRNRSVIRHNIVPAIGTARIDRLGPADLDTFYAALHKSGLKPMTIRKVHVVLGAALHQAVKWGWLDRNPAERASPPTARPREVVPPTFEEVRALLAECDRSNPEFGSLLYVALTTGCRRGELCGLQWKDVDFRRGTLLVARSISDVPGEVSVKDTKTHATRKIALDPSTVEVLRRQEARARDRAASFGASVRPSAYIWSQEPDSSVPYRPDRVTYAFNALRRQLGLEHITLHSLRHFAATTMAGRGVGVRTIAGRLGHADPTVTLRTYAHFLDVADQEAAITVGDVVAELAPAPRRVVAAQRRKPARGRAGG